MDPRYGGDLSRRAVNVHLRGVATAGDAADLLPTRGRPLPRRGAIFLVAVAVAAVAAASPFCANLVRGENVDGWGTFFVIAIAAAIAHIFVVRIPQTNRSYHTSVVFFVAAALLLPPELIVLLGIAANLSEWLKERYVWYVESFNICCYTLSTLAAWGANRFVADVAPVPADARQAIAGFAACAVFVAVNHLLLGTMLWLGRGRRFGETGLFGVESLSTNLVLAALGVALAAFWTTNPWLIPIAIAPLFVVHRTLSIPQLRAEARIDSKTGLFNARHFGAALEEELARATRFERPLSLIMADLDLLREINNTHGHLAGDGVLRGLADVFRTQLRDFDVPARFGGEEFSILLPETPPEQAVEIADRIRRAVAERTFEVETSSEPIRATISVGVAGFPRDGADANELIHQADLAVYRAKLQGRNRVVAADAEPLLTPPERTPQLARLPEAREEALRRLSAAPSAARSAAAPPQSQPNAVDGPPFFSLSVRLRAVVATVSAAGVGAGVAGFLLGGNSDWIGLVAVLVLVGVGRALALETDDGTISVGAVGALAGAAVFGPRAALALALTACAVEWRARRPPLHQVLFNIGVLSLAALGAAAVFSGVAAIGGLANPPVTAATGLAAGVVYFAVNAGLVSLALAAESDRRWAAVFRERFDWLLLHYVMYGFVGGVIAIAYEAAGFYALAVFAVPLLVIRKTQDAYLAHSRRSAHQLRQSAETIQTQNFSLEHTNRLLKERSTAAMESLAATVDARDPFTAGHSRRVQQLALAIGRELNLSQPELDLLGHAALFHDIGKLAIPDSILLKPGSLSSDEAALMRRHADEGARIVDRLGFLGDAVPAIRHHHERWDGGGYPDGLRGDEIPLGARIIHVADAVDSMLSRRIYGSARPVDEALEELRRAAGTQFCPRSVGALARIFARAGLSSGDGALGIAAAS